MFSLDLKLIVKIMVGIPKVISWYGCWRSAMRPAYPTCIWPPWCNAKLECKNVKLCCFHFWICRGIHHEPWIYFVVSWWRLPSVESDQVLFGDIWVQNIVKVFCCQLLETHKSWIQGEKGSLLFSTLHIKLQMFFFDILHLCSNTYSTKDGNFDCSHEWYFWIFHRLLKLEKTWVLHGGGGSYFQFNYCQYDFISKNWITFYG